MLGSSELRSDFQPVVKSDSGVSRDVFASRWLAILPLGLGVVLIATNRWFTEVDDETAIIDRAARPVHETLQAFLNGVGVHEHPPLYDLLLHGWLRLTAGNIHLLRLPAILFYITGAWLLSVAAKRFGGTASQFWTLLLVCLSPFGFHFGRLATWYSCGFLLVSLVTLTYLQFLDRSTATNWALFLAASLALVYTNYFGWALLGVLAIDYAARRHQELGRAARWLAAAAVVLLVAYLPIFRAFEREIRVGTRPRFSLLGLVLSVAYNLYLVFISESVAPWFWAFSILAVLAIMVCFLVLLKTQFPAKRFLLYFAGLVALLAALGIIMSKRSFFITPWLLFPMGVALGTMPRQFARRAFLAALAVCGVIGWYGIFSRNSYVAPHWVEPWQSVAQASAKTVENGGIAIGNNPSFFFYLTYLVPVMPVTPNACAFCGLLPDSVRAANVYSPPQWIGAGRPTRQAVLLVKGMHYGTPADPTNETQQWLDEHCSLRDVKQRVRDSGAEFKQSYTHLIQPQWRVEVRNYSCP